MNDIDIKAAPILVLLGPTYVYFYLMIQNQNNPSSPLTQEPSPAPLVSQYRDPGESNITVQTGKQSYVTGETFKISGNIGKPVVCKVSLTHLLV
jgi:hypothetical protein